MYHLLIFLWDYSWSFEHWLEQRLEYKKCIIINNIFSRLVYMDYKWVKVCCFCEFLNLVQNPGFILLKAEERGKNIEGVKVTFTTKYKISALNNEKSWVQKYTYIFNFSSFHCKKHPHMNFWSIAPVFSTSCRNAIVV